MVEVQEMPKIGVKYGVSGSSNPLYPEPTALPTSL